MPSVAKKSAKAVAPSKSSDAVKNTKKQSLKKLKKTAEINAAKKLAKLKSTKAISDKLNRAPVVRRQKSKHQFDPLRLNRGVLLVKNLPKGFEENELKQYFSQYGEVTRLRLARSERTGGSKAFAYLEFKYPDVAKVAGEAMNGYLMFRQKLQTVYIPPEKQDHDYFKQPVKFVKLSNGKVKLVTPTTIRAAKAIANYNKPVSKEAQANRVERSKYKLTFLEKKLAKAGIKVDLSSQLYEPVKKTEEIEVKEEKVDIKVKENVMKNVKTVNAEKLEKAIKVRKNFVTPPTPEPIVKKKKSKQIDTTGATVKPVKLKKKAAEAVSEVETPKKKVRMNFVSAPTPEPVQEKETKKKKKMKKTKTTAVVVEKPVKSKKKNAISELKALKKKIRTNFVTAPTPEPIVQKKKTKPITITHEKSVVKSKTNAEGKKQAKSQKVVVSTMNIAPKKNKQLKNKKKIAN